MNRRYFFSLLVVLSVYSLLMIVVFFTLFLMSFTRKQVILQMSSPDSFLSPAVSSSIHVSSLFYQITIGLALLAFCFLLYYALELLIFHIRLYFEGATT